MEITYSPAALPGSCYFCGNGSREFYIDTTISVEFHGAMYICNICAGEFARMMKWIPHDEYKQLKVDNEELSTIAYELRKKLDGLEAAINGLTLAGYSVSDGSVIRHGGAVLEDVRESETTVSTGEGELGEGEGKAAESSDDEDVGELRSDDKLDDSAEPFGYLGTRKRTL